MGFLGAKGGPGEWGGMMFGWEVGGGNERGAHTEVVWAPGHY